MKSITKIVKAGNMVKVCENHSASVVVLTQDTKVTVNAENPHAAPTYQNEPYPTFQSKNVYGKAKGKCIMIPVDLFKASAIFTEVAKVATTVTAADLV